MGSRLPSVILYCSDIAEAERSVHISQSTEGIDLLKGVFVSLNDVYDLTRIEWRSLLTHESCKTIKNVAEPHKAR